MTEETRKKRIASLVWAATKQGGFQRSYIYNKEIPSKENLNKELGITIKQFCFDELYLKYYGKQISEKELLAEIQKLVKIVNTKFNSILKGGEFRFGSAQKFVNLYLKLLWILGEVKEPPHFPVDRIIQMCIKETKPYAIKSWTNMDEKEYLEVIAEARSILGKGQSLAEWEQEKYEELVNSK